MPSPLSLIAALLLPGAAWAADAVPGAISPIAAPAAISPIAATAASAPAVVNAVMNNPYGLDALWAQGDLIARGTLGLLVIMSMATWYILVTKLIEQFRLLHHAKAAKATFWQAPSVALGIGTLKPASPFHFIAGRGLQAAEHHEGASMTQRIDLHSWVTMSIQRAVGEVIGDLQGGMAMLATVASTAPFIGLFGTVWGIYHALTAIGIAGQASIDKVAGPVGESLIMTALGLAVAVPAVLGYNWLTRRNKLAGDKVRAFASDLHSVLLSGVPQGAAKSLPRVG